jgi:hypothetical protein
MTINLEKLLDLTIAAKLDSKFLDDIKHMITAEMESEISKKTGKKNQYGNILKYLKNVKKIHGDKRESLLGIFKGKDDHWYITDGYGGIRFNNLEDTKDIPISNNGPDLLCIIKEFKTKCVTEVVLPTEKELTLSLKTQKAEEKNSNNYSIYYKIGTKYYNPENLILLYSLMGENLKGWEGGKHEGFYAEDENGNQMVVMPLNPEMLTIRETETQEESN